MATIVGPPKSLSDLSRIDANPVVTCRHCIWSVEYDLHRLISAQTAANLGTDWRTFCDDARCERCGGPTRVAIKPFVKDAALRVGYLRKQLVFKALCVLEEATRAAVAGKPAPTFGLRFALAYLYAVGRREREGFDRGPSVAFWRLVTREGPTGTDVAGVARRTELSANMNAIARSAGVEITPDVLAALGRAMGDF